MIRILIIEDETIVGLHISSVLKRLNYEVVACVKNAHDAIACIEKNAVDLILADIRIEGDIDGISVCQSIQQLYNLPVIFLTAFKDQETLLRASKVNYSGYLLKPFREDELEALVKLTIAKHNIGKEIHLVELTDEYSFNKQNSEVTYHEKRVKLTSKEKQLISLLVHANGGVVPYERIDDAIWLCEPNSDTNRRQLLYRLKQKLPKLPIESITGTGIKLVKQNSL